ncbi:MAG: hypothetical protein K9N10_05905 [Deltaproteobacteria bacterium]|nr:hypothetical protein [Deltaproteobacteria bacterium]
MKTKFALCFAVFLSILCATITAHCQTAISNIPPEGLAIREPGSYFFVDDIGWEGREGILTAITIKASDVVLDMNGHTLSAPRSVPLSGTIGIFADGADRMVLRNGTVKGFQLIGIALANSNRVTLSEMVVSDVGNGVPGYTPTGIFVTKCQNLAMNTLTVDGINGSWFHPNSYGQIVSGISLNGCDNVSVDGRISGLNGYSNVVSGVFGVFCSGVSLRRLEIDDVNGSAVAVSGASFGLSTNITVEESVISRLHNDAGVCSGIATDDCQKVTVANTTVRGLSTGLMPNDNAVGHTCIGMVFAPIQVLEGVSKIEVVNPGEHYSQILLPSVRIDPPQVSNGTRAVGFPVVGSSGELESVLVLNPGSGYNTPPHVEIIPHPLTNGTGATATAVVSPIEEGSAEDILVENCKISDIAGSCDDAHGLSLFVVSNATVRGVTVENVTDGRGGRGAKATGIEVYGLVNNAPSNILVENCRVSNISAISPGDLQAAGFSVAGKGVTFLNCEASNVTVTGGNPVDPTAPGFGIGFAWAPDIRPEYTYAAFETQLENCTASHCQVGFDTFYFQNATWKNITSFNNDIAIKEESTDVVRFLYCDKCSECPDSAQESPENWFTKVSVKNIASGNTIDNSKIIIYR